MKLSPHFALSEFTASQTATRLMLDNTPGPDEIAAMKKVRDGSTAENALKILGRGSFGANGASNFLGGSVAVGAGSVVGGPVGAVAAPLVGHGARKWPEARTKASGEHLSNLVRSGGFLSPQAAKVLPKSVQESIARAVSAEIGSNMDVPLAPASQRTPASQQ